MSNVNRWAIVVGALLLAAAVGFAAFQAGTAHGIAQSGKMVAPETGPHPHAYPYYGWHGPWGLGFLFVPLFFFAFWLLVVRGLFWRRGCYGNWGGYGMRSRFEEWHRQAHAGGPDESAPPGGTGAP